MPPKKEEPKPDLVVEIGFVIVVLIFLYMLWSSILDYLIVSRVGSYAALWAAIKVWLSRYIWPIWVVTSVLITILTLIGIAKNYKKLMELNKEEKKIYGATSEEGKADEPVHNKNERWERVIGHLNSANANDWRLAIIEADVMLDEALRSRGYYGDSLGEMLKGVDKSDMLTLDEAWEAHKVRNQVAHAGSDYLLNEREAKHVISLYEKVFKEFKIF